MRVPAAVLVGFAVVLALQGPARAQEQATSSAAAAQATGPAEDAPGPDPTQDKPGRVARLTFLAGAVRVERVDNTAAEDTPMLNMPLVEGTRLVTGDYGQAEVEFEDGSVVRLTPRSVLSLDVLSLADGAARTQMTLLGGMAYFELRKAAGYAYQLNVAGAVITPAANVTLRVNVDEPPATLAVLAGEVRVEHQGKDANEGFKATVRQGESLRGDSKDDSRYFLNAQIAPESWDQWNVSRDAAAADEADVRTSARDGFAGQQGYGWSDLDASGSWYDVPGQGQTWQPAAADDGFDPYGYGSWVYVNTSYAWVSGYAWGWTPFRCGRWTWTAGFGWGWLPGRSCGVFGYAGEEGGYGGVHLAKGPPHYNKPLRPMPGPGHSPVHPILIVHGPDGARPALKGGAVVLGKVRLEPLRPLGGGPGRGTVVVGQALNRDFPVDRTTGQPVLGREATNTAGQDGRDLGGWIPVQGKPGAVGSPGSGARPGRPVLPTPVARVPVPPAAPTIAPTIAPARAPQPVRAAPIQSAPVQNAPVRVAPAPAPARPVSSPAPAPPATVKTVPK